MPVVVHLSDLHFGADVEALAESLLTDVADQRPDLVVVSGDLTQRARPGEFERAREILDQMPAPVLTVVGNHDLPLFNLPNRLLSPTRRYERYITTELDPVVVLPGLALVGLDTMPAWRWKAGHVSPRQAGIVREALGSSPRDSWRLLVTHHPVLPPGLSGLVGRDLLVEACAESGVAAFLSGHIHATSAHVVRLDGPGRRHSALAVVAGTTTSTRTRGKTNSYAVLRLSDTMDVGARLTLQVREPIHGCWSLAHTAQFEYSPVGVVACIPEQT